ncbi:putative damage-inducible protein DinB [Paenibacillus rhizosphaerae]|uniref:Putative damage-inducible protein DinB n=1 Tax=Paenibacillus rhizosphaerae TaxID=297318 RepID=A0A839TFL8_9BACL|nr:DinB family protein [Paenibacillus rhizosphaerae]MBB3125382.1 putative damage-inducible protein DinB [Paenibacillus rhizosphaerae]
MANAKEVLSDQLFANADDPSWYTPFKQATEGLSEVDAFRKLDANVNSISEITQHLLYWNETWQERYRESRLDVVSRISSNDESFVVPEGRDFKTLREALMKVLSRWQEDLAPDKLELRVDGFDESVKWWQVISNVITHNAYHIGQIVYIRKLQDNWTESAH